jgi:hypothetical protein
MTKVDHSDKTIEEQVRLTSLVTAAHVNNARAAVARRDVLIREASTSGLSYAQLAELSGLSRPRIQQIVNAA